MMLTFAAATPTRFRAQGSAHAYTVQHIGDVWQLMISDLRRVRGVLAPYFVLDLQTHNSRQIAQDLAQAHEDTNGYILTS